MRIVTGGSDEHKCAAAQGAAGGAHELQRRARARRDRESPVGRRGHVLRIPTHSHPRDTWPRPPRRPASNKRQFAAAVAAMRGRKRQRKRRPTRRRITRQVRALSRLGSCPSPLWRNAQLAPRQTDPIETTSGAAEPWQRGSGGHAKQFERLRACRLTTSSLL
eukprot:322783-Chlamydomonas_euryale.AAC.3